MLSGFPGNRNIGTNGEYFIEPTSIIQFNVKVMKITRLPMSFLSRFMLYTLHFLQISLLDIEYFFFNPLLDILWS